MIIRIKMIICVLEFHLSDTFIHCRKKSKKRKDRKDFSSSDASEEEEHKKRKKKKIKPQEGTDSGVEQEEGSLAPKSQQQQSRPAKSEAVNGVGSKTKKDVPMVDLEEELNLEELMKKKVRFLMPSSDEKTS